MAEIKELKDEVARLKDELYEVRKLVQVNKAPQIANVNKDVTRVDNSADTDGFQIVRNGRKVNAQTTDSATLTVQNRFPVLQEETEPKPDIIPVGDSNEFCRGKPNRKHRCYRGRKIEYITEIVDYLVENSTEDTLFVTVSGTNNLYSDTTTDIVDKYRGMLKEFAERGGSGSVGHHSPI